MALVLSFVVVKIVSFAVANTATAGSTVAKIEKKNKKKRVRFVDDEDVWESGFVG